MQITLIRHGKSTHSGKQPIPCCMFGEWMEAYDARGVVEKDFYLPASVKKARSCGILLSSDLKRARETAYFLAPKKEVAVDPVFREVDYPSPNRCKLPIALPPLLWSILFRVAGVLGYRMKNCESYPQSVKRAEVAARLLIQYALSEGEVALVGHGFFNYLVAKELRKSGWYGNVVPDFRHWHSSTYILRKKGR
ncbi:MAG: phosphoglycerate mutase family protein [Turicibacter sp.]|nr:phosphoglycerate mutase family protein [Turicibacter sp.]